MRLGCVGCLLVVLALVIFGVAAAGAVFFSVNIFDEPEVQIQPFTTADGYRAQQKLYEIVLRESERSGRADPITFTERELNAFLSRHLIDDEFCLRKMFCDFTREVGIAVAGDRELDQVGVAIGPRGRHAATEAAHHVLERGRPAARIVHREPPGDVRGAGRAQGARG